MTASELTPDDEKLMEAKAAAGFVVDAGVDSILASPAAQQEITELMRVKEPTPERLQVIEAAISAVMEQEGVGREEAEKLMLGTLSQMLADLPLEQQTKEE